MIEGKTVKPMVWIATSVAFGVACASPGALAAEPRTEHTFRLAEGEERPAATLDAASFLVGSWVGTAFGEKAEESWSAPTGDSMVGTFKLFSGDEPAMYEIMLLTVEDGTLSLKVRHFNADFTAWEDKGDYVNFQLVKHDDGELHFGGLSFYRRGDDRLDGYIVMRQGDEVVEQHLAYERIP
ncbi:MAG: DUF6265 family protein [Gammaproteobacteria bacterium]|nr:DUF6265 family protein [Gammaproteobacteria bacterium]